MSIDLSEEGELWKLWKFIKAIKESYICSNMDTSVYFDDNSIEFYNGFYYEKGSNEIGFIINQYEEETGDPLDDDYQYYDIAEIEDIKIHPYIEPKSVMNSILIGKDKG